MLVETDQDFNVISRFTRGYEVVATDIANSGLGFKLSRYYYTVDEQDSTAFITDKDQEIENGYYYDAFGNLLDGKEQVHNGITYTGQQFDGITRQYYLRARLYNPVIGRFTQEYIYRSDGLNLYAYCKNNPVMYYDPSGYSSLNKERPFALPPRKTPLGLPEPSGNEGGFLPDDYYNKVPLKPPLIRGFNGSVKLYRTMSEAEYSQLMEYEYGFWW